MPMVAWYMLSKESYMKRVIKEVFPTGGAEVSPVLWKFQPLHTEEEGGAYHSARRGRPI